MVFMIDLIALPVKNMGYVGMFHNLAAPWKKPGIHVSVHICQSAGSQDITTT